jgi:hypothetical protein
LFSFILSPGVFCLSTSTTAQHFLLYCCIWNDAHFDRKCLASLCNSLWQTYVYSYATKLSAPSICARVLHLVLVLSTYPEVSLSSECNWRTGILIQPREGAMEPILQS